MGDFFGGPMLDKTPELNEVASDKKKNKVCSLFLLDLCSERLMS